MASTIQLKRGSGAPTSGDLAVGEPAFDLTNKRLYTEDTGGSVIEVGTNPSSLTTTTLTATTAVRVPIIGRDVNNASVNLFGGNSAGANVELYGSSHATLANEAYYDADVHTFRVSAASPSAKLVIDSFGNVLIGTTDSFPASAGESANGISLRNDGQVVLSKDGGTALILNRGTSDGYSILTYKNGSYIGGLGSTTSAVSGIFCINDTNSGFAFNTTGVVPCKSNVPTDNTIDLGGTNYRWDDVYATNGTIQTSDVNEKQDVEELSDVERIVAVKCKALLRKYRWKDSVAEKGDDARIHFGIIAQDLKAAFESEGLDAGRYGMFISSTWTDESGVEHTRLGVRYNQLFAFVLAAI